MAKYPDAYPKLYDLEGTPIYHGDSAELPRIYRGNGRWEDFNFPHRIAFDATFVPPQKFKRLMIELDEALARGGRPLLDETGGYPSPEWLDGVKPD